MSKARELMDLIHSEIDKNEGAAPSRIVVGSLEAWADLLHDTASMQWHSLTDHGHKFFNIPLVMSDEKAGCQQDYQIEFDS